MCIGVVFPPEAELEPTLHLTFLYNFRKTLTEPVVQFNAFSIAQLTLPSPSSFPFPHSTWLCSISIFKIYLNVTIRDPCT